MNDIKVGTKLKGIKTGKVLVVTEIQIEMTFEIGAVWIKANSIDNNDNYTFLKVDSLIQTIKDGLIEVLD